MNYGKIFLKSGVAYGFGHGLGLIIGIGTGIGIVAGAAIGAFGLISYVKTRKKEGTEQ